MFEEIRSRAHRLRTTPSDELSRWARFAGFHLNLWRFCAKRLWQNNITAMSAALSFRTIFTLIPAIVLVLLILKSVGMLEDSRASLHEMLAKTGISQIVISEPIDDDDSSTKKIGTENSGTENSGTDNSENDGESAGRTLNVAEEIERIVNNVESKLTVNRVGPVGVVLLVWTALTLITTLERSLNRIFGASRSRSIPRRLLMYWSVLTLGPLLLMATSYLGDRAVTAFAAAPGASFLLAIFGWMGPILVDILVVAAIYKLLPNTHVKYRAALGGAMISVPIWLVAKWGFAVYVVKLVGGGNLYGALGLLPLFLIWVNLSWLIFLFGAQVSHTAANLERMRRVERADQRSYTPVDLLAGAITVAVPFSRGLGPVSAERLIDKLNLPIEAIRRLVERLERSGVLCRVDRGADTEDHYVLAKPPSEIRLLDVVGLDAGNLTGEDGAGYDRDLADGVTAITDTCFQSKLGALTLADALANLPKSDSKESEGPNR
ncbi:MAG: YihY family inner membrane protein [Phycisphaerales bacterium]|nr:YihY family inner membrane protein [Phycisphaerales bacterium]